MGDPSTGAEIETTLATLVRHRPDLVEIRFRPDQIISLMGLSNMIEAMDHHGMTSPRRILITLPEDDLQFDVGMFAVDHLKDRPVGAADRVMAIATGNATNMHFARLYFAYFPTTISIRCFSTRTEASRWLEEHGTK